MFRTLSGRATLASVPLALSLAAVGLTTGASASTPSAPAKAAAALTWSACSDGFQCTKAVVPLDYDRPNGVRITLDVVKLPAGDPARRIGTLFLNPGGPGGSGVDFARNVAAYLPLDLRGRYDIVGFDPRGVNNSTPLRCFDTFDDAISTLPDFAYPNTPAQERTTAILDAKLATACKTQGGDIEKHMSTADVARDMDFLRGAVGDPKLSFLGFSYGSMLGQTYANLFPTRVRAMVIDGVLDPVAWTTGRGNEKATLPFTTRIKSAEGAQATLNQFFKLCDASAADCPFAGRSAQRFKAIYDRLPNVYDDETGLPTKADLVSYMLGSMYDSRSWASAAYALADLESFMNGDQTQPGSAARAAMAKLHRGLSVSVTDEQEEYPNFVEAFPGVACSDSRNPTTLAAWKKAADAGAKTSYFSKLWTWSGEPCRTWDATAGQDRYEGPFNKRTASPVLVVGNLYDPATPYTGAQAAHRLLPNSGLLTYAGWGHTVYLSGNYCIDAKVTTYLVTSKLPAAGTVCRPTSSPFEPYEVSAQSRAAAGPSAKGAAPQAAEVVRKAVAPVRRVG